MVASAPKPVEITRRKKKEPSPPPPPEPPKPSPAIKKKLGAKFAMFEGDAPSDQPGRTFGKKKAKPTEPAPAAPEPAKQQPKVSRGYARFLNLQQNES